uniref:Reverse transcriptase domain-containing protein n=1 Tax=Aegilops tauschii subsp. strangulata TaxID=200361 RepID=A0A453LC63_AEGTS
MPSNAIRSKECTYTISKKMQNIFNENQAFILVYVDDLLVFSKSYKEHIAHLEVFFRKVEQNGLILSKKKMEICEDKINFLGHEIGEGKIYLQEHIAKKILEFPDNMSDKKVLQQFLGIVNYARNYIDKKLAGPLYAKLRKNGQKYFNSEDIKLVKAIKEKVKNLKPLELPLEDNYFIIETDASKVGWGAILKQKPNKYSPKADEKICRYASGSYKLKTINNIDREILAVVNAINAFRLYLGFKEFTVRTDCEAICRYYNKINKMRKGLFANKDEYLFFGEENRLKMFQPNIFNFKPKSHIKLDEAQRCILDNFWFQYTLKREEKMIFFLSILNSLAEYFNELNKNLPKPEKIEIPKGETLYLIFDGNKPGIYLEWENIMIEKVDAKIKGQDLTFKRYYNIDDALLWARKVLGPDYYI